jgi:glutamate-1-semialdehyde 2,1-aminomutase
MTAINRPVSSPRDADALAASLKSATDRYMRRTPQSAALQADARTVMPGGVSGDLKYFDPYPFVVARGRGPLLTDVDGNEYVDYQLCYSSLIFGHGYEPIWRSVADSVRDAGSWAFGAAYRSEVTLARELVELYCPGGELRFTTSGLEAVTLAIRLATAATGRTMIAKFEGHYHGSVPQLLVSYRRTSASANGEPRPVADSADVGSGTLANTLVLRFNDWPGTEAALRAQAHVLAAVVFEPVLAGFIPPSEGFLERLERLCRSLHILLIADEIKTGLRLGLGGAQARFGFRADVTTLGKVLGGGFPLGAVIGSPGLMELLDPRAAAVFHSGTHNGHPLSVAAALATLRELRKPHVYDQLERQTVALKRELAAAARRLNLDLQLPGVGSSFGMVFAAGAVTTHRHWKESQLERRRALDMGLLSAGVVPTVGGRMNLSLAHDDLAIERTLALFEPILKSVS